MYLIACKISLDIYIPGQTHNSIGRYKLFIKASNIFLKFKQAFLFLF
jgi:hypothetical protein